MRPTEVQEKEYHRHVGWWVRKVSKNLMENVPFEEGIQEKAVLAARETK